MINAATASNTASTLVKRDASGNFTAGTITAALTGNASTATQADSATYATTAGTALMASQADTATTATYVYGPQGLSYNTAFSTSSHISNGTYRPSGLLLVASKHLIKGT